ncbi:nucleolar protein 8-like [Apis cerana]|uniref:nucleolar protein 8-like n=1 Tax=Apis cerana TaxID=7461 RepID=UPI002B223149|nr:nucleolar protein 8-like [Apis cerana]
MNEISVSEKKRLESLKHKKQIFKAKELLVQNALKNLDNKSHQGKIIFDDDIDKIEQPKINQKEKKRKYYLFDNDDNHDENNDIDINKFEIRKKRNIILGNDERFKLDKRFIENDQKLNKNITTNNDEIDLLKEKELQLDILENILGMPITLKNENINKDIKLLKKGMIRYDPTENDHKEFEINIEKSESETKKDKKKKKNKIKVINENPSVEVSKDLYFSVSDLLSKSFKEEGQFSLLNTYRKTVDKEKRDDNDNNNDNDYVSNMSLKSQKIHFDFNSKKLFKYDSSDNEDNNKQEYINNEQYIHHEIKNTNKFFFDINDIRFNEAENFFSKEYVSEDTFKELRQELKQIVRSKIQKNLKKKQPWGYKKKIKRK